MGHVDDEADGRGGAGGGVAGQAGRGQEGQTHEADQEGQAATPWPAAPTAPAARPVRHGEQDRHGEQEERSPDHGDLPEPGVQDPGDERGPQRVGQREGGGVGALEEDGQHRGGGQHRPRAGQEPTDPAAPAAPGPGQPDQHRQAHEDQQGSEGGEAHQADGHPDHRAARPGGDRVGLGGSGLRPGRRAHREGEGTVHGVGVGRDDPPRHDVGATPEPGVEGHGHRTGIGARVVGPAGIDPTAGGGEDAEGAGVGGDGLAEAEDHLVRGDGQHRPRGRVGGLELGVGRRRTGPGSQPGQQRHQRHGSPDGGPGVGPTDGTDVGSGVGPAGTSDVGPGRRPGPPRGPHIR